MAITTADGWFGSQRRPGFIRKTATATTVAANPSSLWDVAGNPGAASSLAVGNTTTGLVPTDATAGFPSIPDFAGGATGYLATASFRNSVAGGGTLYDRVFHAGSVLLTSLATTTLTTQPSYTGRLPGGNDYTDLEIFIEINVTASATATTVAVNYTNEAGTTGRTTGASGSLSGFITRRLVPMPLQAGDKGVQKIESVTVGGTVASTGTFNVIVARRLADFDVRISNGFDNQSWDWTGGQTVFQDSALWPVVTADSTSSGLPVFNYTIASG